MQDQTQEQKEKKQGEEAPLTPSQDNKEQAVKVDTQPAKQEVAQPSLIKKAKTVSRISIPHKSFIIALVTITATVIAGILLAQFLKGNISQVQTNKKPTEDLRTPTKIVIPTKKPRVSKQQTPEQSESQFTELLEEAEVPEATTTSTTESTESAAETESVS